ncbi:aminopeptidase [Thermomicrobium sp. CFH 73360]|uniref:aminopeptidase n=1 Tax=Thermomicrobium sp. CFH 73360 TaxID=2951987 RepID=UPI0020778D7F|nr:aminopeptidase [Thermomicrobium sp. CFH 73360]MCM8746487.1 aminopeptidase [Thermomicrobium sp. CFH 73360]
MTDPRITQWAKVLVDYSLAVQPEQLVVISGTPLAAPLIREVFRLVLERGAYPVVQVTLPGLAEILFKEGSDRQLRFISPDERLGPEQADALLRILSESNTKALTGVDPSRQQLHQRARTELRQTYLERAAAGALNWCVTLYPTEAYAQDAEMSLAEYEGFVLRAGFLDQEDPVAAWQEQAREQARIIEWLSDKREVHIRAPDTDLRLSIAGRRFVNADGRKNFPDGEIFTGPVEDSVEGTIRFTYPSMVQGRQVEDIRLRFEGGRVVEASAARNEAFLHRMLETDEGARYVGEFAFGLNRAITRFTGNILFDEKIGGTLHLAIGAGYPETGSRNRSAVHWDMICDLRRDSEVWIDGQLFMKDGEVLI